MGHPFKYLDRSAPPVARPTTVAWFGRPSTLMSTIRRFVPMLGLMALVFLFLDPSAHAFVLNHLPTDGTLAHGFTSISDLVGYGSGAVACGYAASSTRQGNQIDLRTQAGVRTLTVAPGTSVQYIHDPSQARVGASGASPGMYNCIRKYTVQVEMTVVRAGVGEGTEPIYADYFPASIKSIGLTTPMHGTLIDPSIVDGMVAKHIMEWHSGGYQNATIKRQPIPAANGTYTRFFELELFLAQYWNEVPDEFDFWLGWMDNGILEIFCQDSLDPFDDGGVTTITDISTSVIVETVPWPTIVIPPFVVLRRYEQAAAAGSNGPKLQNVGDAGALQGCDDGARLLGMFFSHQVGGFTGSGTADDIATLQFTWRDQAQTYFPSLMFQRYLRDTGQRSLGLDTGIEPALFDIPQEPYTMPGSGSLASGPLNDQSARFTPLVWPSRGNKTSQAQRVKGNYGLDGITFSAPQSNVFRVYTLELKQFSLSKVSEMVTAMGIDPKNVVVVPKAFKGKLPNEAKAFGMPRFVAGKK